MGAAAPLPQLTPCQRHLLGSSALAVAGTLTAQNWAAATSQGCSSQRAAWRARPVNAAPSCPQSMEKRLPQRLNSGSGLVGSGGRLWGAFTNQRKFMRSNRVSCTHSFWGPVCMYVHSSTVCTVPIQQPLTTCGQC